MASILVNVVSSDEMRRQLADAFAVYFKDDNPNFSKDRFLEAANVLRGGYHGNPESKFRTALDEAMYVLSLDGQDDGVGDSSEGNGWYGLMLNVVAQELQPTSQARRDMQKQGIVFPLHAIVFERSDGIVEVTYFDSAKEAEEEWEEVVTEVNEEADLTGEES